ncbi:MAG: hypothetical protein WCU88_00155 [Elusimicrobiota bacterium]|jgi:DNA-binding transcriptional regulator YiaG
MPNIGTVLKEEIRRLARKEYRAGFRKLHQDVMELKRRLKAQRLELLRLSKEGEGFKSVAKESMNVLPEVPEGELGRVRMSGRLIRVQRKRLGLARKDFAVLIGASPASIFAWETGRVQPRAKVKAALAAIRRLGRREARQRLELLSSSN